MLHHARSISMHAAPHLESSPEEFSIGMPVDARSWQRRQLLQLPPANRAHRSRPQHLQPDGRARSGSHGCRRLTSFQECTLHMSLLLMLFAFHTASLTRAVVEAHDASQEELLAALLKEHWFKFAVGRAVSMIVMTMLVLEGSLPAGSTFVPVSHLRGLGLAIIVRLLQRVMSKAAPAVQSRGSACSLTGAGELDVPPDRQRYHDSALCWARSGVVATLGSQSASELVL